MLVTTPAEAQDAIAELLSRMFGQPAASYTNFETGQSTVSVFLDSKPASACRVELRRALELISSCGLDTSGAKVGLAKVPAEDWAESWKRHFKPISIGKSLLVLPSWISWRPSPGQAAVILDPGLSFGTGQHPTTSFCLRQVVRARHNRAQSLLDIGTGSGILAIAAVKVGFEKVDAFDFDPEAVRVAQQNARANHVEQQLSLWRQDLKSLPLRPERQYDLVCANLVANLLLEQRRRIVNRLTPGGLLALAGILKREFPEVQAAYESCGLRLLATGPSKEWQSGAFVLGA